MKVTAVVALQWLALFSITSAIPNAHDPPSCVSSVLRLSYEVMRFSETGLDD